MNAVEINIRDHVHAVSGVSELSAYARMADNESVNGTWTFSTNPVFNANAIPETAIIDGALLARLAANESVTGNWAFTPSAGNTLFSAGNVGIGIATPVAHLQINAADALTTIGLARVNSSQNCMIKFATGVLDGAGDDWILGLRNVGNSDLRIYSYGISNDVMTILRASGYIGIGSGFATPDSLLHVFKGSAGAITGLDGGMVVENSNNTYVNILSPKGNFGSVFMGNPTDGYADGGIEYDNNLRTLKLRAAGTDGITITGSQFSVTSRQIVSTIASGTTPMTLVSPALVTNLNADMVDGYDAANFVILANISAVSAYRISAVSIANISWTPVIYDTENFDTGADHSTVTGEFDPVYAGYYFVSARGEFAANATGIRGISIERSLDGVWTTMLTAYQISAGVTYNTHVEVHGLVYMLGTGQTIRVKVYQDSGGNLNFFSANSTANVLTIHRVR